VSDTYFGNFVISYLTIADSDEDYGPNSNDKDIVDAVKTNAEDQQRLPL
jgi:hypothetical protein